MNLLSQEVYPVIRVVSRIFQGFWESESLCYCDFGNFFEVRSELCYWFCRFHYFITKSVEPPNIFDFLADFDKKAPAHILITLAISMNLVVKMVPIHRKNSLFLNHLYRIEIFRQKRVIIPTLLRPIIMHFFSLSQVSFR